MICQTMGALEGVRRMFGLLETADNKIHGLLGYERLCARGGKEYIQRMRCEMAQLEDFVRFVQNRELDRSRDASAQTCLGGKRT